MEGEGTLSSCHVPVLHLMQHLCHNDKIMYSFIPLPELELVTIQLCYFCFSLQNTNTKIYRNSLYFCAKNIRDKNFHVKISLYDLRE